jgi:transcription initiation factor TFIIIB Brf1 subunit/transcription initiation factor TFIIB
VTAEDVATVARHDDPNEIRSSMHTLGEAVGVGVAPPTARARLTRLIGETSLDVPEAVRTDALELLEGHGSSRSPTALAAAALYLAGGGRGRYGGGRWTQVDLSQACDVCPQTIRDAAHVLNPGYGGEQA